MVATVDYTTLTVEVPQADLTLVGGTFYTQDTNAFWRELKAIEASEEGISFPPMSDRNAAVTIAGTTFAPGVQLVNGFNITYEDGQYSVQLNGTNNNLWSIADGILNQNQVQVIPTNSAGLVVSGSGVTEQDKLDIASRVWDSLLSSHVINGTFGWLMQYLRKRLFNRTVISNDDSTTTLYDDDKSTVLETWNHPTVRERDPQ